jgi:uncharacterized membrane protein YheB (UPF0754 family)
MKVELNLKDDSELRSYIKDMIRGSITNIIREELHQMAEKQLSAELKKTIDYHAKSKVNDASNRIDIAKCFRDQIKTITTDNFEEAVFQKAFAMLQRDDAAIESIIDKKLKGISLTVKI